jgi:maleate cis-trans isomerase
VGDWDNDRPKAKIGYLSPLAVIDNGPYEFYQLAPRQVMLTLIAVGLQEFSAADVERVYAPIEKLCEQLMEREVDVIVQGGVPLPILIGREALQRLLDRIEQISKVPASATVLCVVEAAKGLGLKKIAVANKWTDEMNHNLADFFAAGGIEMIGHSSKALGPAEFQKMSAVDSLDLAYALGKSALERFPEADGVYIGGGAWLTLPVITRLEQEYGKPVITNAVSNAWHLCRMLNCWQPRQGFGTLIAHA